MTDLDIMQRAKVYMEKLAQGIDPISDQEIPEDSVLNNVRLARCFFYIHICLHNNSDYLQKARKYGHFTGYKN